MTNRLDLHEERLSTTDEHGHRVYVHPEDVKGHWRSKRTRVYWFLIILYMVLPWLEWKGKQIILLDIVHREFIFFGQTFYAHDAPLILLLLLGFLFTMGLITSLFGRAWCGWACPQTVFIDTLYRKIELLIEGKARARKRLDAAPFNFEKLWKRTLKWIAFLIVSLHISHSLLGYFVGTRKLFWITLSSPDNHPTLFIIMLVVTGIFLFDFGWFKEQFCLIACPYGRIQSVMTDPDSLQVAYDTNRGEPRKGETNESEPQGDCINCYHCVKVCPTGIDIRRGLQLECIACTQCIDACDNIMERIGKPKGLIRYESENGLEGKKTKRFKFRNAAYLIATLASFTILFYAVSQSGGLKVTFIRGSKTTFRENIVNDKKMITNNYKIRFDYKGKKNLNLWFVPEDPSLKNLLEIKVNRKPFPMKGGESKHGIIFFRFPVSLLEKGIKKVKINIINGKSELTSELLEQMEVSLIGPLK